MSEHREPRFPEIGVLGLVPDEWYTPWQPRHQILTRLARCFQVVWVNPAPEWRQMFARSSGGGNTKSAVSDQLPGFGVYDSVWLPKLYNPPWLASRVVNMRLNRARELLLARGCRKIVVYIWRPELGFALDVLPFDLSCYHIDDEYSFSETERKIDPLEMALIAKVDHVFIHSPGLMEKKGGINPHTMFVPNGVDFRAYSTAVPEPYDLARIQRPIIGYTGYIKKQLDWPLIIELAKNHCEWSFVFVGPKSPHPEIDAAIQKLESYKNVHFLGLKPTHELAAYPQHFDVCIMPYRVDAYTNNIYPLKLHEYLASGRPTISSAIRSVRDFPGVIAVANGPGGWSLAINEGLEERANGAEVIAERQHVAREHDWDKFAHMIARTICERLKDPCSLEMARADCAGCAPIKGVSS